MGVRGGDQHPLDGNSGRCPGQFLGLVQQRPRNHATVDDRDRQPRGSVVQHQATGMQPVDDLGGQAFAHAAVDDHREPLRRDVDRRGPRPQPLAVRAAGPSERAASTSVANQPAASAAVVDFRKRRRVGVKLIGRPPRARSPRVVSVAQSTKRAVSIFPEGIANCRRCKHLAAGSDRKCPDAERDRSMFSAHAYLARHVFPPKNGPVSGLPVNGCAAAIRNGMPRDLCGSPVKRRGQKGVDLPIDTALFPGCFPHAATIAPCGYPQAGSWGRNLWKRRLATCGSCEG